MQSIEKTLGLPHLGRFLAAKGMLTTVSKNNGVKKMNDVRDKLTPAKIIDPTVDKSIATGIIAREYQDRPENEDRIRGVTA